MKANDMNSSATTPVMVVGCVAAAIASLPTTAMSVTYHSEQGFDAAVTSAQLIIDSPEQSEVGKAVDWQDVVTAVTGDHRPMETWEREATDAFFDSLFD